MGVRVTCERGCRTINVEKVLGTETFYVGEGPIHIETGSIYWGESKSRRKSLYPY